MDGLLGIGVRLLAAAVFGGIIGLERELSGKPAGLRTNLLICAGAALITHLSLVLPGRLGAGDPTRIAAQIVSGIGFLGAGTILQSRHAVHGLTSAAVIWVVAGIGMVAGAGLLPEAALATALAMVALVFLRRIERSLLAQHVVTCTFRFSGTPPEPADVLSAAGLRRSFLHTAMSLSPGDGGTLQLAWRGTPTDLDRLAGRIAEPLGLTLERWEVTE